MNYGITQAPALGLSDCLVLGLFSDNQYSELIKKLGHQQEQLINRLFAKLSEAGDSLWQSEIEGHSLMVFHCGEQAKFNTTTLHKYLDEIVSTVLKHRFSSATLCLPQIVSETPNWQIQQMILQISAQVYQLTDFKTEPPKPNSLESVEFYLPGASNEAIEEAQALSEGIKLTRRLTDLPANICTPSYLAEQALNLAQEHEGLITTKIMHPKDIRAMGMNALLAVAQGSEEEPRFIEMQYSGGGNTSPIVFVGKGITFDSGGISLKPANNMDEMKYDMSGAAAILGAIKACALMKLPINLVGLVASAENMPSGSAVKPGDIITSMSGQTIEITNTDAEGRLVLADALTYAERFKPKFVIDLATLTGAIIIALGYLTTGFMTENEELAARIMDAGKSSGEKIWRMPMDEAYQEALDSTLADMINASFDRSAASITAACFLSRFTKKYPWAHLDIAGTAWVTGKKHHATGRPVGLLVQLLRDLIHAR